MGGNIKRLGQPVLIGIFAMFAMSASAHGALPGKSGVIAFQTGGTASGEVGTVDPFGLSLEMFDGQGSASGLSFFPDGKRVVYVTGGSEIRSAEYPSWQGDRKLLDSSDGWGCCVISDPVVSSSGREIYFEASNAESVMRGLWRLSLKDRSLGLVGQWYSNGLNPAFSPDGSTIAMTANSTSHAPLDFSTDSNLLFMDPDGTHQRFIDLGGFGVGQPDFSPDGKRVIFIVNRGEDYSSELFEHELGSKARPTRIETYAEDIAFASDPVYSPDGRYVAFMGDDFGGTGNVYRVRLSDGRIAQMSFEGYGYHMPTDWQRSAVAVPRSWKPRAKVLNLQTFAASQVRVSGSLVRLSTKTLDDPGIHRIQVKLKPRARRILRSRGRIPIRIQISVRNSGESWSKFSIKRVARSNKF